MMRVTSWIRARYQATAALCYARFAHRRINQLESITDDQRECLRDTDSRMLHLRDSLHALIRQVTGPPAIARGLNLVGLRSQICDTEQTICNLTATVQLLRKDLEREVERNNDLESRLAILEREKAERFQIKVMR